MKYSNRSCDNGGDDYEEDERDANSEYHHPKRSSGGVFCSRWDWGRAVNEPAMRLRGSFEDRRLKELDQMSCADGHSVEMDGEEDDEESIRTEAEDVDDDEEEAIANEASGDAKASVKSYAAVKVRHLVVALSVVLLPWTFVMSGRNILFLLRPHKGALMRLQPGDHFTVLSIAFLLSFERILNPFLTLSSVLF